MTELGDGEISSQGCLTTFLAHDTHTYTEVKVIARPSDQTLRLKLTNIRCLNHAHIITTITNAEDPFFGIMPDKACDLSLNTSVSRSNTNQSTYFLGWRATAAYNRRQKRGYFNEFFPEVIKA